MTYFLYGLFFVSCIVLIITVLLQPGKSDAGALFTSSVSSNAFGSRGTATVLSKTTIIAATVFMLSALMLAMPALNGNISVLATNPDSTTEAPANTDANVNANTAVVTPDANANSAVTVPPITNVSTNSAVTNVSNTATVKPATTATVKPANTVKNDPKKEANTKK